MRRLAWVMVSCFNSKSRVLWRFKEYRDSREKSLALGQANSFKMRKYNMAPTGSNFIPRYN